MRQLHQLSHPVLDHVFPGDLAAIRFAAYQRLGKFYRLLCFDFAGHWRGEWIDYGFDQHWAIHLESLVENRSAMLGIFDGESRAAASARKCREIDRVQLDAILRISQKHHLLPLDLAQQIVFDDDYANWQLILHCCHEIRHQHREAAVADEREYRPVRMRGCSRDSIRQTASHGGQIPGTGMPLSALSRDVARPPGSDGAAVTGDDRVGWQTLAEFVSDYLRTHGLVFNSGALVHQLVPLAHALLRLLQEGAI